MYKFLVPALVLSLQLSNVFSMVIRFNDHRWINSPFSSLEDSRELENDDEWKVRYLDHDYTGDDTDDYTQHVKGFRFHTMQKPTESEVNYEADNEPSYGSHNKPEEDDEEQEYQPEEEPDEEPEEQSEEVEEEKEEDEEEEEEEPKEESEEEPKKDSEEESKEELDEEREKDQHNKPETQSEYNPNNVENQLDNIIEMVDDLYKITLHNGPMKSSENKINILKKLSSEYLMSNGIGAHKLHLRQLPWNQARKVCIDEGGQLADIRSDSEEKILLQMMAEENVEFAWLGYHDIFMEGDWVSVLGEPLGKSGWDRWWKKRLPNPDNHGGNEDCACLMKNGGGMNDNKCSRALPFICKITAL